MSKKMTSKMQSSTFNGDWSANVLQVSDEGGKYWFDEDAAERPCRFIERFCRHVTGELQGQPVKLLPFQRHVIRQAFGWKRTEDNRRRFTHIYLAIPKKNGKSFLLSALGLYLFLADDEPGAEVYSVAGDREQARIIFEASKAMVELDPVLSKKVQVFRNYLYHPKSRSTFKVLSSETSTKHGFNIHGLLFDELHVQPDSELFETLVNGIAARRQPLVWMITTAGFPETFAEEKHKYAERVLKGEIQDEVWLPAIWQADRTDDPFARETWYKANPALGVTIPESYFEARARTAQNDPTSLSAFLRLHLNIWVGADRSWEIAPEWPECNFGPVDFDKLYGRSVVVGVDLSGARDLTAVALFFPSEDGNEPHHLHVQFWVPEEGLQDRIRDEHPMFGEWVKQGWVRLCAGRTIQLDDIYEYLHEVNSQFNVLSYAFDRWGGSQLMARLEGEGLPVVGVVQDIRLSPAVKELERYVYERKINHGGNPVMQWMVNNVVIYEDINTNRKINKKRSKGRIDGFAATITAVAEWMRWQIDNDASAVDIKFI